MKTNTLALFLFSLFFTSCAGQAIKVSGSNEEASKLKSVITEHTEAVKYLDPFYASYFNVEEDLDKFGDYASPEFREKARLITLKSINALKTVREESLPEGDRRTYSLFKGDLDMSIREFDFPGELLEFNQMGNRLHAYIDDSSEALTSFPFNSVKHYDAFVKRSEGFPIYIDNQIQLLRRGIKEKITLGCVAAKAALNTYHSGLEPSPEKNPFYRPILFIPKSFSETDRNRLSKDFKKMIEERILPGIVKFDNFFRKEYLPHCRSTYGIGSLPRGKEWYEFAIHRSTNLPLKAKEVHQKGLSEVARIRAEIEKIKTQMSFKGTYKEFIKAISNDPKYFFKNSEQMISNLNSVREKIQKKIPDYFNLVPKTDYKIVESSNPEDAAGSYNGPTDNLPFGRFLVNSKNLRSIPIYETTTLSLHETIPGHHFQLALQFEMKDKLSEYQRKMYFSNAFAEGWALYSEYLGNEMGMYEDPVQRLGNLNAEMLRAVRLVVDSGIHAYGWSREKTMKYMAEYLASDEKGISNEANRYSVWPGQALGYKIGQLKIIELRKESEEALGSKFDIKEFHRIVIGNGTVSLSFLEKEVKEWIIHHGVGK